MNELGAGSWLILSVVWLSLSFGTGAALAWWYKRLHPSLSFYKLWAAWTILLSVVAAVILMFS